MKSTLKFALVVLSFAFLTACGGASKPAETSADTVKTETPVAAPTETPVAADTTTKADTTKK